MGDERDVVFRYTPTGKGASGPRQLLAGRRDYIQADAASVFDRLLTGAAASAVEVGCWRMPGAASSHWPRPTRASPTRCNSFGGSTASRNSRT